MEAHSSPDAGPTSSHQALPHQERAPSDRKLVAVLDAIKKCGFSGLFEFLQSFLTTKDEALSAQAAVFARDSILPLLKVMIPRSRYAPRRRNTKRKTDTMSEELGNVLVPWAAQFLEQEMAKLANDPRARLAPSEVCLLCADTRRKRRS